MEFRFFALFLFFPFLVEAQGPRVPSRLEFADMKLRIMEDARKEIQEDVDKLTRSPSYFNKQVEKAKSYFPIIERVFKEESLPEDFKYLVLQESGLISDAVSSSNAVGFWQFKDFTAMEVGLRVDRQVDERMNIVSASRGAARYLKKNNNSFFDNWLMSLQAYQMGPGTALKVGADKHRGEKSMTINKKTYWYVKKYLAHKIAYENAINGSPQVKLIEHKATANESLDDIAGLYRVNSDEVDRYNKWLRKGRIPGDREYTVIVPTENANLVALSTEVVSNEQPTTITTVAFKYDLTDPKEFPAIKDETSAKRGELVEINGLPGILAREEDNIPAIAALGGLELSKFLKYNDLAIDDQLIAGQVYYLKSKRAKARARYHVAAKGESVWGIAQKYGVKEKKLRTKNRMKPDESLKPGRVVWLRYIRPGKVPVEYKDIEEEKAAPVEETPLILTKVDSTSTENTADTDVSIGNEKNEEVNQPLTFLQKLDSLEKLDQEQTILITNPSDSVVVEEAPILIPKETLETETRQDSVVRIHSVTAGETFYAISKKYKVSVLDILEWNNLTISDKLSIDQKIKVFEKSDTTSNKSDTAEKAQNEGSTYQEYVVKEGDTLYSIARSNGVKVEDLLDWNGKTEATIKLNEILKIKGPERD